MRKTVYIFRGAPASGKTTLSRSLARKLPKPVATLEQDYFRWGIHNFSKPKSKVLHGEHILADRNLISIFRGYLKDGNYTIILDGPFTWDTDELGYINSRKLIDIANSYGYKCINIILKADAKELIKRNAKRKYAVPIKVFNEMYDVLYKKIDKSEIIFDTTNKTKTQSIKMIVRELFK